MIVIGSRQECTEMPSKVSNEQNFTKIKTGKEKEEEGRTKKDLPDPLRNDLEFVQQE
jgi:hypothetical protein